MARQPFQVGAFPDPTDLGTFATLCGRLFQAVQRGTPRGPSTQTLTMATTIPDGNESENVTYRCDATGGAFPVTLPKSISSADTVFTLRKVDASANAVTWQCQGNDTVQGSSTGTLAAQWDAITLHCRTAGFDID